MKKRLYITISLALLILIIAGWGAVGHKIINRKSVLSFPSSMSYFSVWADSLAAHGSDADNRKSSDSTESRRHYIDIDGYSGFIINHRIPQTLDSLNNIYGYSFVVSHGTLPFAIIAYTDSVKKYFLQNNFQKAMLRAADVGHYVADAHQPLHITQWYDGWSTFSNGIHSRYETGMIGRDSAYIIYSGDTISYVSDINQFAFNIVYNNYKFVDSVYRCDSIAHVIAGNATSNQYYQEFWNRAGNFTIQLFKNASKSIAALIYTAWINAGSPLPYNPGLTALLSGNYNGTTMVPKDVTVELHNSTTPYALVESKIVTLNSSGFGNPVFTTAVNGTQYYIVLKSNNGLETWSAAPQTLTGSTISYDFTSAASQAFGSNQILIGTKWCIISGDVNQDGSIDALDRSACWNDRNLIGVYITDLNGDGVVDALDRSVAWNNRNLSVQKPTLMANLKSTQDNKGNKDNSKSTFDLRLDGSNAKKVLRNK